MPLLDTFALLSRNASAIATNATNITTAGNATGSALQVICAWPVSGQYGPGSRILYYVLIAACIFARKAEWLRNACLAAALLFPAVAAIHGIVLASVPMHGAVDMDVYGAFQLCSIGILTAPVTVKLSRTYFYDPGRNAIFLWTGLILAGLLSLTVEFFRLKTSDCRQDDNGNPVSTDASKFPYGFATCGLTCSVDAGPHSPMRGGSANNIYVIPAPDKLTFGTATLFSAGCCVPAILSLVFMWNKILEINWKARFGDPDEELGNEPISGTNGATVEKMNGVNAMIRSFLSAVEVPVFGAAILALLIIGERNFFSHQVFYQTEPLASVGQWAPIVGAGLAVLGSLYLMLATDIAAEKEESNSNASIHSHESTRHHHHHCNFSMQEVNRGRTLFAGSIHSATSPDAHNPHHSPSISNRATLTEIAPTMTRNFTNATNVTTATNTTKLSSTFSRSGNSDVGNRRKVAKALNAIGNHLGAAAHIDNSEFKHGKALDFPEIPGEEHRNRDLPQIRTQYNQFREEDEPSTPLKRTNSRAGSTYAGSIASGLGIEGVPSSPRAASPPSTFPRLPSPTSPRSSTLPVDGTDERPSAELQSTPTSSSTRIPRRRDTLEVPSPLHHGHRRTDSGSSYPIPIVPGPEDQSSPAIVVSPEPEMTASPAQSPGLIARGPISLGDRNDG